ncbi:MAG: LytTR family transcriptional regulator DNA-binding domain-containing protein [Schleiferilactobacillus harbinensis]|jgi:DNA-binding LytR/AlgR family response regulator|nr:LytTR family transcriptional regulator DNA-binding domain-containing protein [Schleiferilactobacillus harbinensis]MCI1911898.1 LytTR family transcriptional regulator DNA-binding domain-containing protein [Schleiferilactobacillus harbinensis]
MVRSRFLENKQYPPTDPAVTVEAAKQDQNVQALMAYIDRYGANQLGIVPVKTDDRIQMVRIEDIIMADVQDTALLIYTTGGVLTTRERLTHFAERLASPDFVQVSKHAMVNLNHLLSLEDSFSGSMTAKLSDNNKTSVSRKYVQLLAQRLGL